jgi:2-dehydropantoate 2-reductase
MQRIVLGEYDGRKSTRAQFLHEALLRAGVTAELSEDVRKALWEKYVFLVGLSGTTTTMRKPIGPIRENAQTRAFRRSRARDRCRPAHGVALPEDFVEDRSPKTRARRHDLPCTTTRSAAIPRSAMAERRLAWKGGRRSDTGEPRGVRHSRPAGGKKH